MEHAGPSYGLWTLVMLNVAVFAMFTFGFFQPASARDWRSFGAFTPPLSSRCPWMCMDFR